MAKLALLSELGKAHLDNDAIACEIIPLLWKNAMNKALDVTQVASSVP